MRVDLSKPLKSIDSDVAQVCENGHVVNWFSNESLSHNRDFCPQCGTRTQTQCAKCRTPIEGGILYLGLIDPDTMGDPNNLKQQITGWDKGKSIPDHCGNCGQAFPWAGKQKQANLSSPQPTPSAPIVISNSPGANVNFGQGTIHQEVAWARQLYQTIDSSLASETEKKEAKSLLERVTENPLLNTVVGGVLQSVFGAKS